MRISDWSSDVCSSDLKSSYVVKHCREVVSQQSLHTEVPHQLMHKYLLRARHGRQLADHQVNTGRHNAAIGILARREVNPLGPYRREMALGVFHVQTVLADAHSDSGPPRKIRC